MCPLNPPRPPGTVLPHGSDCTCTQLAQAIGLDPAAISYHYCNSVLQKRWQMQCQHGRTGAPVSAKISTVGRLDPVRAILASGA